MRKTLRLFGNIDYPETKIMPSSEKQYISKYVENEFNGDLSPLPLGHN